jgi:hypothetical protein
MGGEWSYNWQDGPETFFELVAPGHGGAGFAARVAGKMDGSDDSRLTARFRPDHSATDLSSFAGIRFWARGDGSFRVKTVQPTITDWDDYGTSLFQATPRLEAGCRPVPRSSPGGLGYNQRFHSPGAHRFCR